MDDMIYRNDPIAEENIDPHGRPATDVYKRQTAVAVNVLLTEFRM